MACLGRAHEDEAVVRVVRHHLVHLRLRALLQLAARREAVDDDARDIPAHVEAEVLEGGLGDDDALRHAKSAEQLGEELRQGQPLLKDWEGAKETLQNFEVSAVGGLLRAH